MAIPVHKLEVYVVDFDNYGLQEVELLIKQRLERNFLVRFGQSPVTKQLPEWDDKHPLNMTNENPAEAFEKL